MYQSIPAVPMRPRANRGALNNLKIYQPNRAKGFLPYPYSGDKENIRNPQRLEKYRL